MDDDHAADALAAFLKASALEDDDEYRDFMRGLPELKESEPSFTMSLNTPQAPLTHILISPRPPALRPSRRPSSRQRRCGGSFLIERIRKRSSKT
jgi:hypothetical protein